MEPITLTNQPTPTASRRGWKITLISVAILALLAAAAYIFWPLGGQDTLVALAPRDSQLYLHLNYQPRRLANTPGEKLANLLLANIDDSLLKSSPLKFSGNLKDYLDREIALGLDQTGNQFLILKLKNYRELLPLLEGQHNLSLLSGGYLVVTTEPKTLENINNAKANPAASLRNQLTSTEAADQNFIQFLFQPSAIVNLFNEPAQKKLLANFLPQTNANHWFLSADQRLNFSLSNNGALDATPLLADRLPPETLFSIASNNLLNFFQNYFAAAEKSDPIFYRQMLARWQDYQTSYRFESKEIEPLLDHPAQLIVTTEENTPKYLLLLQAGEGENLAILEMILKNIAARQFPAKVEFRLPDNTLGTELIGDPANFRLEEVVFQDQAIKIVKNHQPVWELVYTALGDQLIIGNSLTALERFLAADIDPATVALCPNQSAANLVVNPWLWLPQNLQPYQAVGDKLIFSSSQDNKITGCWR
jgi:hypothetical protein